MRIDRTFKVTALLLVAGLIGGCAHPWHKPASAMNEQPLTTSVVPGNASGNMETSASAVQPTEAKNDKIQIYPGTGVLVRNAVNSPSTSPVEKDDQIMLNFDGADLREVVKAVISDILGENYIIDPSVPAGSINLHTSKPLPRSALMPTLETLLRMNGTTLVMEQGIYKVVPLATASHGSITPQLAGNVLPPGYSVQIVPLSFVSAKDMVKLLEPFLSDPGSVRTDDIRNLLILSGTEYELKHLMETISMFDVDWLAGMSVGLFTLQSVDVKTASADLDKIFGDKASSPLSGLVKLVPIERLNAFLVVTTQPQYLEQAKTWIERFDRVNNASGGTRLFVYPVQNGQADKLATLINDVFGSKSSSSKTTAPPKLAPGLTPAEVTSGGSNTSSNNKETRAERRAATQSNNAQQSQAADDSISVNDDIRIIADKDNNALLILASPSDYEKIEAAIRKLDIPPRQVLIDVTIAEVTLTDEFKYGLEWYLKNGAHQGGRLDTGAAGISALTPGFSYVWAAPGTGTVGAALNALATDSRVKVISSPHIMVTDNQDAKISVGDRVPTTTQTQSVINGSTNSGVISSIQYLDTGILLSVTPHINAGGMVTMEINQEVSSANKTTTSGIDSPTISKRAIESTVVVKSGDTMLLGGLITENKTKSTSGLPWLSRIPILGGLFGTQDYVNDRTELVVMITPKLVVNSNEAAAVTQEFRTKLHDLGRLLEDSGKFKTEDK